jgi:PBSX family phage terminase large subunit
MSKVKPLSRKAINSIKKTGYLNAWEGAVRSSKTVVSILAWIAYVACSSGRYFIMSGKTIATLYRNVIGGDFGILSILGNQATYKVDRDGNRLLIIHTAKEDKICYCFGANDERSYTTLRGLTAEGWYADEVNLHPRSFVEEAFRRTIVSTDRKHFWTLNPDNPYHYIYVDFLDKYEEQELPGFYLWHFTLDDNLAIPPERKEELKSQYAGIFYRRYILGERCLAEGIIYDMFDRDNLYDDSTRPDALELLAVRTIAVDYGTANPCVFLDIYDDGEILWVDNEYRWDSAAQLSQKTDAQYADDMVEFMGGNHCEVVCDPSAASFITALRDRLIFVTGAGNDVADGIRIVSTLFEKNHIKVHEQRCPGLIKELSVYPWDEKAARRGEEQPVKGADHGPDALRYHCNTKLPKWRISTTR